MCSASRDLFKFWEISGNISKTVQGRDIYLQLKTNRKSYMACGMAPLRVTFSDIEIHFAA